ncbi:MAG TPA: hypothetical protein DEF88_12060 [Porphyromonadaceae bacterium]|jgi:hypothetical protein|nr:hypothetical protein [Porphyromonadaceae bacterium]HCM20859.1 hypothetical protein [Porphyromonadaceae bacterium]
MKKIVYLLFMALIVGYASSCKDMDSIYKDFIVPNGYKYPQAPDSLKVYAGYNKLRLIWFRPSDPSVVRAEVYWNNYQDTLKIDIASSSDIIQVDVPDLGEDTYTFYVKTFDEEGNVSIPAEVTGTSYGDNYIVGATDRTIVSALRDDDRNGTITWNPKTTDLVYSEVRYTTFSDKQKILRILPEETALICPDIKSGEPFEYRSVFLPPKGIDSVAREWIKYEKPFMYKYPRTDWTVVAKNGNHDWGDGGGGQPALLFDGKLSTGWHSRVGSSFPQCLVVDMKQSLPVDYITIYPPEREDWRYLKDVEIYLTETPVNPDDPNLPSILSSMTPVAEAQYPGGNSFSIYLPSPLSGRYLTVVFPNGTQPYISFMELDVYGY